MRRASFPSVLATTVALCLSLPAAAAAAVPSAPSPAAWSSERAAAGNIGALSTAIDDQGHVHIAASAATGLVYITDRSGAWETKLILANGNHSGHEDWDVPSIALDETGHVWIAAARGCFECAPGNTDGIWLITDQGHAPGTFGVPQKVAGTAATDPSLKVHAGHVYLAYGTMGTDGPGQIPVYFKTDASGPWTRVRIARDGYGPSLRVDSTGHARVAYAALDGIRYARATTLTGGFVVTVVPGSKGRTFGAPSLALDTAEQPQVAWEAPSAVLYARATSGGWSAISKVGPWAPALSLSVDAGNVPHVAIGRRNVVHVWRTGGTWHTETVALNADPYVGGVAVRATPTGLFIVYARTTDARGVWVARS